MEHRTLQQIKCDCEKCEKCEKSEKREKSEKCEKPGKRSFLSKIKEAITTGSVSSDADVAERSARLENGDGATLRNV